MSGSKEKRIAELQQVLQEDPASAEFVELAQLLAEQPETRPQARDVCFRGLTENPKHARGRLLLARLFYLDGFWEFAVRELYELQKYAQLQSLTQLIAAFGEYAHGVREPDTLPESQRSSATATPGRTPSAAVANTAGNAGEGVVAELDLDAEFLDALDDLEE